MARKKKLDQSSNVKSTLNKSVEDRNSKVFSSLVSIALGVVGTIVAQYFLVLSPIKTDMAVIDERSKTIQSSLSEINGQMSVLVNSNAQNCAEIEATQKELLSLYDYVHINVISMSNSSFAYSLIDISSESNSGHNLSSYKADDVVGVGVEDGQEYLAEQVVGVPVLLIYREDEYSIVFYGYYNEKYHWDGKCLINTYVNGELEYISDSVYDDGMLVSSIDVYKSKAQKNTVDVWSIYDRVCNGDYNIGTIKNYYYEKRSLDYDLNDVKMTDLIYPRSFENSLKTRLEGFYYGKSSNNKENDDSGNAYMVKYDDQGYVRTLYIGKFKNGMFDDSDDALEIVFDASQSMYFAYLGPFELDERKNSVSGKNYVDYDMIQELIEGFHFDCPLKWNITMGT